MLKVVDWFLEICWKGIENGMGLGVFIVIGPGYCMWLLMGFKQFFNRDWKQCGGLL